MLELDPQIAKAIASEPPGQVVAETLAAMRAASDSPSAPPSPGVERRDYCVGEDPGVVIRVHRPAGQKHVYAGAPHGVKRFADVPVARRYIAGINEWIGAQLQASSAQAS
jgi:hypothetical protein